MKKKSVNVARGSIFLARRERVMSEEEGEDEGVGRKGKGVESTVGGEGRMIQEHRWIAWAQAKALGEALPVLPSFTAEGRYSCKQEDRNQYPSHPGGYKEKDLRFIRPSHKQNKQGSERKFVDHPFT